MNDGYTITLTITDTERNGAILEVERTSGTNCDLIHLKYVCPIPFHPLRKMNKFWLSYSESTIPSAIAPKTCICVSAQEAA